MNWATSSHVRYHRVLVVVSIALAMTLLVVAGLFSETVARLRAVPIGFETEGRAVAVTRFTGLREPQTASSASLPIPSIIERLSAIPGVESVAAVTAAPFFGEAVEVGIEVAGNSLEAGRARSQVVAGQYFEALGTRILRGRALRGDESEGRVAVVSKSFEDRFFGGSGLGAYFQIQGGGEYQVVGVAEDVLQRGFLDIPRPTFYVREGRTGGFMHYVVRMREGLRPPLDALSSALTSESPQSVVVSINALDKITRAARAAESFQSAVATAYASTALLLAAVGLFGLSSRRLTERLHEIGIRLAIGARPIDVRSNMAAEMAGTVAAGLCVGTLLALATSRVIASLLYGVSPTDPRVILLAVGVLSVSAAFATGTAIMKAGRVSPATLLKQAH